MSRPVDSVSCRQLGTSSSFRSDLACSKSELISFWQTIGIWFPKEPLFPSTQQTQQFNILNLGSSQPSLFTPRWFLWHFFMCFTRLLDLGRKIRKTWEKTLKKQACPLPTAAAASSIRSKPVFLRMKKAKKEKLPAQTMTCKCKSKRTWDDLRKVLHATTQRGNVHVNQCSVSEFASL